MRREACRSSYASRRLAVVCGSPPTLELTTGTALRSWQISVLSFAAFAIALGIIRTPKSILGVGIAVALAVALRVALEAIAHGRGGEFAQLKRIGKPLGLLALAIAAATILIQVVVHSASPVIAVADAVFAAVFCLALDSIARRIFSRKNAQ
jgi:hypothetical protein